MGNRGFEILEHPADVGFRAYGQTREELYENAAAALFYLICGMSVIEERESREITATGKDEETLLYAWLAELLAVAETERMVFRRVDVTALSGENVRGTAYGEPYDAARHEMGTSVKAITFHQLKVEKTAEGWSAQVFVDV